MRQRYVIRKTISGRLCPTAPHRITRETQKTIAENGLPVGGNSGKGGTGCKTA
jgi:hypothetical protein